MNKVIGITLSVVFAGTLVYFVVHLIRVSSLNLVRSTDVAVNDGDVTASSFTALLDEARRGMVIYDDGDKVSNSNYMNDEIVRNVRKKLKENPDFRIRCLFNYKEDLAFREIEGSFPSQMEIRKHDSAHRRLAMHYKIIDDGRKAYLSRHEPNDTRRHFRVVDLSNMSRFKRKLVSKAVLGTCLNHFEREFSHAGQMANA